MKTEKKAIIMSNTYWEWHRCRWLMTGSRRIYDDGETLKWVVVCVCVSRLTLTKKIKCIRVTLGWFKRDKFLVFFDTLTTGEKVQGRQHFSVLQIQFNYYPFLCVSKDKLTKILEKKTKFIWIYWWWWSKMQ